MNHESNYLCPLYSIKKFLEYSLYVWIVLETPRKWLSTSHFFHFLTLQISGHKKVFIKKSLPPFFANMYLCCVQRSNRNIIFKKMQIFSLSIQMTFEFGATFEHRNWHTKKYQKSNLYSKLVWFLIIFVFCMKNGVLFHSNLMSPFQIWENVCILYPVWS